MGHELTAYYGIDHARTLAIIALSHYRYNFETKKEKLAQYAERVWGITEGTVEEKAAAGIAQMEYFFHSMDIATKLSRSEEHTSELQSRENLVCRLLLEKKKKKAGRNRVC